MRSINSCLVHVVRRFGCVGGMERYVWELTHRLIERDLEVVVVCEEVFGDPHPSIKIIKVNRSPSRPRWRSMMRFRSEVDHLFNEKRLGTTAIIHSHERTISHQVTTFHGPPIDPGKLPWLKVSLSRRIRAWQSLEWDELLGAGVQKVLTVSSSIGKQLLSSYPDLCPDRVSVAWPGVYDLEAPISGRRRELEEATLVDTKAVRFGFVGLEWKRKGLDLATDFVGAYIKEKKVVACLNVYGPDPSTLPGAIRSKDYVKLHGWCADIPWQDIDVLLHLARVEPFGMVVAEARRAGVPVVATRNVGATEVGFQGVESVMSFAKVAEAVDRLVSRPASFNPEVKWTWNELADFHLNQVYPSVIPVQI